MLKAICAFLILQVGVLVILLQFVKTTGDSCAGTEIRNDCHTTDQHLPVPLCEGSSTKSMRPVNADVVLVVELKDSQTLKIWGGDCLEK